jgi:hypothetical protein
MRGREVHEGLAMHKHEGGRGNQCLANLILDHLRERSGQVLRSVHVEHLNGQAECPRGANGLLIVPSGDLGDGRRRDVFSEERNP